METSVYRKPTHTDVYLNWNACAPTTWKTATVKSLVKRALSISSTEAILKIELTHLKKVFTEYNNYPIKFIENIIQNEINKTKTRESGIIELPSTKPEIVNLSLPYAGQKGEQIIKKMKNAIKKSTTSKIRVIYNTKKLSSKFQIKDQTRPEHQHNIVYHVRCLETTCESHYIGQTKCRLQKRALQHNKTDKHSHLPKHANNVKHNRVWLNDFKVLGRNYKTKFKRKISESLFIKEHKPDLNVQKDAYRLKLYS